MRDAIWWRESTHAAASTCWTSRDLLGVWDLGPGDEAFLIGRYKNYKKLVPGQLGDDEGRSGLSRPLNETVIKTAPVRAVSLCHSLTYGVSALPRPQPRLGSRSRP